MPPGLERKYTFQPVSSQTARVHDSGYLLREEAQRWKAGRLRPDYRLPLTYLAVVADLQRWKAARQIMSICIQYLYCDHLYLVVSCWQARQLTEGPLFLLLIWSPRHRYPSLFLPLQPKN